MRTIEEYLSEMKEEIIEDLRNSPSADPDIYDRMQRSKIKEAYFCNGAVELDKNSYLWPLYELQLPDDVEYDMAATDNWGNRFYTCYGFVIEFEEE